MKHDVLIVGGGLAGASLAVALGHSRLRVGLIDERRPQKSAGWDIRIYAISPANQRFLDTIGIWGRLDASRVTPVHEMQIFGDDGAPMCFSAYDSGVGELAWTVEQSQIHCELWETLSRQHNVNLYCPRRGQQLNVDATAATLELDDGTQLEASLVVAADGGRSWVRQQAGIGATVKPYNELGVVANFRCERAHHGVAYQWFTPQGVLAYLPLPGNHMSMVWSAPEDLGRELLELDAEQLASRVADRGENVLGRLQLETTQRAFPLQLMNVDRTVVPRVALIGDAAHAIHPLSGHGVNLGLQDSRALANELSALAAWRDPGELAVLRAYARARAEEPAVMQFGTHFLNRLFKKDNFFYRQLRNRGMRLTDRLGPVKSALVRYATGDRF